MDSDMPSPLRIGFDDMPAGVEITSDGLRFETKQYLVVMAGPLLEIWDLHLPIGRRRNMYVFREREHDPVKRALRFADLCRAALLDALPVEVKK